MSAVASPRSRARASAASAPHTAGALALEEVRVFERDRGLRGEQLERDQALGSEGPGHQVVLEVEEGDELCLPADGQAEHRARTGARMYASPENRPASAGASSSSTRSWVRFTYR